MDIVVLLNTLNGLSPLAIIGLLAVVIYFLVKGKEQVHAIGSNHLSDLPKVVESLQRLEVLLEREFAYIRAKLEKD